MEIKATNPVTRGLRGATITMVTYEKKGLRKRVRRVPVSDGDSPPLFGTPVGRTRTLRTGSARKSRGSLSFDDVAVAAGYALSRRYPDVPPTVLADVVRAAVDTVGASLKEEIVRFLTGQGLPAVTAPETDAATPGAPADALTAGERSFFAKHSGLTEEALSDEGHARAQKAYAAGKKLAAAELAATSLTTKQVAKLLGRAEANVRRSRLDGHLYSPGTGSGQSLLFPEWQFTDDHQVIPGLKAVLAALPDHLHPLSVERFMTALNDDLDGMSPVQWLTTGGPVEAFS